MTASAREGENRGRARGAETKCGARNRNGTVCERPAGERNSRCRRHGGAKGIGGYKGNKNALKHGIYTPAEAAERKRINEFIRSGWRFVREWERGGE